METLVSMIPALSWVIGLHQWAHLELAPPVVQLYTPSRASNTGLHSCLPTVSTSKSESETSKSCSVSLGSIEIPYEFKDEIFVSTKNIFRILMGIALDHRLLWVILTLKGTLPIHRQAYLSIYFCFVWFLSTFCSFQCINPSSHWLSLHLSILLFLILLLMEFFSWFPFSIIHC